jgi:hypothetical protein
MADPLLQGDSGRHHAVPARAAPAVRIADGAGGPCAELFPPPIAPGVAFMTVNLVTLQPLVALIAGVLILLMPRLLNYIVAIYLIVIGIAGLVR